MSDTEEIRLKFFNSLKRGTGEAYFVLRDNPTIDFSDLIIKGAIKNFAKDPQAEGSRADYIFKFIKKTKQKEKIIYFVLKKLLNEKKDDWGFEQTCDLAVHFYKNGYLKAKDVLYERFEKKIQ